MIKADIYIKVLGVSISEEPDTLPNQEAHTYTVRAPIGIFTDIDKVNLIGQKDMVFNKVSLEWCSLPAIYGRVMSSLENPTIV